MKHFIGIMAIAVVLVALGGCAITWQAVKEPAYTNTKQGYTVTLPAGWLQLTSTDESGVLLSHDGVLLNLIHIQRVDNAKAFPHIKKEASPDLLSAELAANYIAEGTARQATENREILQNEPATVGGKDGFHVSMEFRTKEGLRYRSETYGVCTPDGFYTLMYRAPEIYYFEQSMPVFQTVVTSFHLTNRSR